MTDPGYRHRTCPALPARARWDCPLAGEDATLLSLQLLAGLPWGAAHSLLLTNNLWKTSLFFISDFYPFLPVLFVGFFAGFRFYIGLGLRIYLADFRKIITIIHKVELYRRFVVYE